MSLPPVLQRLKLPVIGAPMFIAGNPKLVIEQCKAGIVGSFPALNARPKETLDAWLTEIETALAGVPDAAPYAVNQIVHSSNNRLAHDIAVCREHKVPIQITSLRAPDEVVEAAHSYGGLVYHDVTNVKHAKRALQAGVDGLILVCSGAGGHAGSLSAFALLTAVREFYEGTIILSGAISTGAGIIAAQALGADLAYMGTRFIASQEGNATEAYKQAIVEGSSDDIVYSNLFTGVHGNYLAPSIRAAGLDPDNLPESDPSKMNFGGDAKKAWKDIWGCGQGIGAISAVTSTAELVARLRKEYETARERLKL